MNTYLSRGHLWVRRHPRWSAGILILAVLVVGYRLSHGSNSTTPTYVWATAKHGPLTATVSGTGQVTALNQVGLTSKVSGPLVYLKAQAGQEVTVGTLLAQVDASEAAYELETAKLSYQKLAVAAPSTHRDAETTLTRAQAELNASYNQARTNLATTATDLNDVLTGIEDLLSGYLSANNHGSLDNRTKDYLSRAKLSYYAAKKSWGELVKQTTLINAATSHEELARLVTAAHDSAVLAAQATQEAQDATLYLRKQENRISTIADSAYSTVTGLVTKANTVVTTLASNQDSMVSNAQSVETAEHTLSDLDQGLGNLDLRAAELALKQKQEAYNNYFFRAPLDGVVASVNVKPGQEINNGDTIATVITHQESAEISLNEIDAAKVAVGQSATLSFDALDDLKLVGTVSEADLIGTVSQGVVNYKIKISFATNDPRVKPGMTVNATITTAQKDNVIAVPTSAIKTRGEESTIQIPSASDPTVPQSIKVATGLATDDAVEIVSGLEAGARYVVRTITPATNSVSTAAPSLFGGGGNRATNTGNLFRASQTGR